eukprot:scaffold12246_cov112-Isochrysis_galbana.AAC.2
MRASLGHVALLKRASRGMEGTWAPFRYEIRIPCRSGGAMAGRPDPETDLEAGESATAAARRVSCPPLPTGSVFGRRRLARGRSM